MEIKRHNINFLREVINSKYGHGVILPGIVGSGKTYLISNLCSVLKEEGYEVLFFEGDDSRFRSQIREDSGFIRDEILSKGLKKPFVYVDEIQKEPEIFDAVKIAYDKCKAKFIVSGSNPALLRSVANDRLQRRGLIVPHLPFSMSEAFEQQESQFADLLSKSQRLEEIDLASTRVFDGLHEKVDRYLKIGGLPQSWLSENLTESMTAVKLVAERGITDTYKTTIAREDEIRRFLGDKNSQEFTYKGLQQSLRSSKRSDVDDVLDHLLNHGYILKKTPFLGKFSQTHKTYFAIYSWVDPGLVSYYSSSTPNASELGMRLESYVHTRLFELTAKIPFKSSIHYYKPFIIKPSNNALHFGSGEIDFVVSIEKRLIPIEVKRTYNFKDIDTSVLEEFIEKYNVEYGIVLYGGAEHVDFKKRLIYYPFWKV